MTKKEAIEQIERWAKMEYEMNAFIFQGTFSETSESVFLLVPTPSLS